MRSMPAVQRRGRVSSSSPWLTNPTGQIWHTLTSVRLALMLILLITLATLAGTLLNQVPGSIAADPAAYNEWLHNARDRYGAFTPLMDRLQLFRVFSSIWFRALIALLVANIVVCTVNRWNSIRAAVFVPRVRMNPAYFDRARIRSAFSVNVDASSAAAAVRQGLRSAGYRSVADQGESVALYADRFRFSRLGTFLTHLSLVLLLIGAIMGRIWGWKDDQFIVAQGATQQLPLAKDISVKLEQFQEEWYVEGPPKDFESDLVIYDNGQEVKRGTTRVNSPLSYHGITFNQAFYGQVAVIEARDASGNVVYDEGVPLAWTASQGNRPMGFLDIPGTQLKGYVVGPEPGSYDTAVPLGTVRLELYDRSTGQLAAIESLSRNQDVQAEGLTFRFLRESQFTGLKVVKDPGVNVVWIASGLMVLGLVMVFWFPHRRLWALCTPRADGGTDVSLAAASQRDLGLERDFEQVSAKVRRALTRRQQEEKGGVDHV
jgi:cytochrome c biogenesis protein